MSLRPNAVKFIVKTVIFHNWTDRHFRWAWDGSVYDFPPGSKVMMEDWKANHFGVHLVDQFCDFEKKLPARSEPWYKELLAKCVIALPDSAPATTPGEASRRETELLNQPIQPIAPTQPIEVIDSTDESKPERPAMTEDELAAKMLGQNKSELGLKDEDVKAVEAKIKSPFCDKCDSKGHFHKVGCPKRVK